MSEGEREPAASDAEQDEDDDCLDIDFAAFMDAKAQGMSDKDARRAAAMAAQADPPPESRAGSVAVDAAVAQAHAVALFNPAELAVQHGVLSGFDAPPLGRSCPPRVATSGRRQHEARVAAATTRLNAVAYTQGLPLRPAAADAVAAAGCDRFRTHIAVPDPPAPDYVPEGCLSFQRVPLMDMPPYVFGGAGGGDFSALQAAAAPYRSPYLPPCPPPSAAAAPPPSQLARNVLRRRGGGGGGGGDDGSGDDAPIPPPGPRAQPGAAAPGQPPRPSFSHVLLHIPAPPPRGGAGGGAWAKGRDDWAAARLPRAVVG